jgi:hypothetical protein
VDARVNDGKTVQSAFLRFRGLLHELGLSPHAAQALSVKLEVDTNPPAGATLETSIVRHHLTVLRLQHHDRASLLAGKLHALLQRSHVKGRDLFDVLWYLGDPGWPPPNLELLGNALEQTGWAGPDVTSESWREVVRGRISELAWDRVASDVRPFLEPGQQLDLLTRDTLLRLLEQPRSRPQPRNRGRRPR